MTARRISLRKAKRNKLFYIVASVVLYRRPDRRCLILRRALTEAVAKGKWGVVGGKLEHRHINMAKPSRVNGDLLEFDDVIDKCLVDEIAEEAGPDVLVETVFHPIGQQMFVRPDGIPVLLLKYAAIYHMGAIRPNPKAFSKYAWVNMKEAKKYDYLKGILKDIATTIRLFSH